MLSSEHKILSDALESNGTRPVDRVSQARGPKPRLALVWTRNLDREPMAGRLRVAHAIREAVTPDAELTTVRLPSMVTDPTVGRMTGAILAFLASWMRGQPLPIQCAIFASGRDLEALTRSIPNNVETVYLDGIRCYELLRLLRRKRPYQKIVVDFDDLMSRRMELLLAAGETLSPGYLTDYLPPLLRRLAASDLVGRSIVLYESWSLKALERQALRLADSIVLLSSEDALVLDQVRAATPNARARITTVPPAVDIAEAKPVTSPYRFVFVGTDALTQNRLTIDYLLDLWRRHRIRAPLAIFGRQTRKVDLPPNVTAPGYVGSLQEIHDGHSVMVTPSFIRGGIKTKVLEAFSFGRPVIGNNQTFEAMPIDDYPLRINEEDDLLSILRDPHKHGELFQIAGAHGQAYVRSRHAPQVFAARWRHLMGLSGTDD
jgi:glycosyltransferase involved in cell wall biosynthesis